VPLIDGTYEIVEQRPTGDGRTLILATDPDGIPVRIVWYDVPSDTEAAFEIYRRALRRLARAGGTTLREVVSRPGARYAVWEDPGFRARQTQDPAWHARLAEHGIDPSAADLRMVEGQTMLAALDWSDEAGVPYGVARPETKKKSGGASWDNLRELPDTVRTWIITTLLLLTAVVLALSTWSRTHVETFAVVPDVIGLDANDAAQALYETGFTVLPRSLSGQGTPGTVVTTDPPAGSTLRPGRTVRMEYLEPAQGTRTIPVPDVTRQTRSVAEATLRERDLSLGAVARIPSELPSGIVLAQRPNAGAGVIPNGEIDLLVSSGPQAELGFLPDLVGLDEANARNLVRLAGIPADRILLDRVVANDAPLGSVVAMTPLPWHAVRVDDVTVRLFIADPSGATPFTGVIPEAPEQDPDEAADENADENAPSASPEEADATQAEQEAPSTEEPAGPRLPDVVGLTLSEARQTMAEAGVSVELTYVGIADVPPGVILQEPAPGAVLSERVSLIVNAEGRAIPVPSPSVTVEEERLRWLPYTFLIVSQEREIRATVLATTINGVIQEVERTVVAPGETLSGRWATIVPGPVTFELRLGGVTVERIIVTEEVPGP